jgi:hypothetical protein
MGLQLEGIAAKFAQCMVGKKDIFGTCLALNQQPVFEPQGVLSGRSLAGDEAVTQTATAFDHCMFLAAGMRVDREDYAGKCHIKDLLHQCADLRLVTECILIEVAHGLRRERGPAAVDDGLEKFGRTSDLEMRCVLSREASVRAVFELGARAYCDRIIAMIASWRSAAN